MPKLRMRNGRHIAVFWGNFPNTLADNRYSLDHCLFSGHKITVMIQQTLC